MKTLVIGGGMSGLTYGILSAQKGNDTVIFERNSRVGKKIAMTGNGKCNIGNVNSNESCFNTCKTVSSVLKAVPVERYVQFLQSCGIFTFADSEGRMYPLCESSSNVVDCLRKRYADVGGKTVCDADVQSVRRLGNGFEVTCNGSQHLFDKVVVACGSGSGCADVHLAQLVGQQYLTPLFPSLVPLRTVKMDKTLSGLRVKANVRLLSDGECLAQQSGEVQFKEYGLSGICIFNLSATVARRKCKGNFVICLDVVPHLSLQQLQKVLASRTGWQEKSFYGILHNKLGEYVVKHSDGTPQGMAQTAKNLSFAVDRPLDFSMSQVTSGGVSEKFLDENLTLPNGLTVIGEALDVDGICGGNNLYFAAASALYLFR